MAGRHQRRAAMGARRGDDLQVIATHALVDIRHRKDASKLGTPFPSMLGYM